MLYLFKQNAAQQPVIWFSNSECVCSVKIFNPVSVLPINPAFGAYAASSKPYASLHNVDTVSFSGDKGKNKTGTKGGNKDREIKKNKKKTKK